MIRACCEWWERGAELGPRLVMVTMIRLIGLQELALQRLTGVVGGWPAWCVCVGKSEPKHLNVRLRASQRPAGLWGVHTNQQGGCFQVFVLIFTASPFRSYSQPPPLHSSFLFLNSFFFVNTAGFSHYPPFLSVLTPYSSPPPSWPPRPGGSVQVCADQYCKQVWEDLRRRLLLLFQQRWEQLLAWIWKHRCVQ